MFVGGTGMYFKALLQGLSDIPAVPDALRARVRAESEGVPPADLHARLARWTRRRRRGCARPTRSGIVRALEIFAATGAPLARFQGAREKPLLEAARCQCVFLGARPADAECSHCRAFRADDGCGAMEEAQALLARGLDPPLPAMRAVGVPGLLDFLRGACSLEAAVERGKRDSRQYAKRQFTFARTQLPEFAWIAVN